MTGNDPYLATSMVNMMKKSCQIWNNILLVTFISQMKVEVEGRFMMPYCMNKKIRRVYQSLPSLDPGLRPFVLVKFSMVKA